MFPPVPLQPPPTSPPSGPQEDTGLLWPLNVYFIYFEVGEGQRERERETPKQASHCWHPEPTVGLNPTNHEIMTRVMSRKLNRLNHPGVPAFCL